MKPSRAVLIFLVACFAMGAAVVRAGDDEEHHERRQKRKAISAPENVTYRAECASCHMLYPPGLLPARSWKAMMGGLKDHFGENASLDPGTAANITQFLVENGADQTTSRRSQKISKSIAADDAPLRITETNYFKRQHHEVSNKVWQRKSVGSPTNCAACHSRAEAGVFSEDEVRVPR